MSDSLFTTLLHCSFSFGPQQNIYTYHKSFYLLRRVFFLGFDSDEAYDLRPLSEFKFFHESRNSHKSDVLDSISDSYEGTRKILADSEPKGPFYIPSNVKIDYHTDASASVDLPHPTVNIGNCFYIKSPSKSINVHVIENQVEGSCITWSQARITNAGYECHAKSNF